MNFQTISAYTANLKQDGHPYFEKMEQHAHERKIPIIQKNGIQFIQLLIKMQKPKYILEIGTAIGYSATKMVAASDTISKFHTIERNPDMVSEAVANIEALGYSSVIQVIEKDALEVDTEELNKEGYDLIFIDAAKGQYQNFFEKYRSLLRSEGLIITDNVLFRGIAAEWQETENKRLAKIGKKVDGFNRWLAQQPDYETTFLTIGDGIAITRKKG